MLDALVTLNEGQIYLTGNGHVTTSNRIILTANVMGIA